MTKRKSIFCLAIAIFLFSLSFNVFQVENGLVTGGVTGIVLILNKIFNVDIPTTTFIINLSFLILGYIYLGKGFFFKTVLGSLVFYPFFLAIIPVCKISNDMLVNALCGGALMGIGISFLLISGGSSGGTSLLSRILNKYTKIPFSICIFLFDGSIILTGFIVFGIDKGVYALIFVLTSTLISNKFEKNIFTKKQLIIVSKLNVKKILESNNINWNPCFQSHSDNLSILVVSKSELKAIKAIIESYDESVTLLISDVS